MACERNVYRVNVSYPKDSSYGKDCILETVKKIDQAQKAVVMEKFCEGCDSSLFATIYNTKPVTFYLNNGKAFEARIPGRHEKTELFRIEEVKNDCVILRLIKQCEDPECLDFTVILKLDCVCGLQCFPPICCDPCKKICGE